MSLLGKASLVMTPNAIKESKVYSIIPSSGNGDLTFTRATLASSTLNNDAGLIEIVPYNLLTYSEQFNDVVWVKQSTTVTSNVSNSPNGTLTADKIIPDTSSNQHRIYQNNTFTGQGVLSVYAKADGYNFLSLGQGGIVVGSSIIFNLSNGTISGTESGFTPTIENIGNGWYRCSIYSSTLGTGAIGGYFIVVRSANNISNYNGDGVSGILTWGAQLVQSSLPKDYFFTTDRLNVPRLNYDASGGCPSLLLEPQRTNLNLYSNNLENANWSVFQATRTVNSAVSPDGTTNAIKLTEDSTTNFHSIFLPTSIIVTSGQTYSRSVYLKQAGRMWASLIITDNSVTYRAWFDLQNGVLGTVGSGITAQITNVGNGWYRCTIIRTAVATTFVSLAIEMAISNGVSSYLGNGTSGIYVYGAQLELGAYATSYIPTISGSVTRNADTFSRNNIYTNGLITSAGGTWFVELNNNVSLIRDATSAGLTIDSSAGFFNTGFLIRNNFSGVAVKLAIEIRVGGTVVGSSYLTLTDTVKIAIKWDGVYANVYVNGVIRLTNVPFTTKIMENLGGFAQDVPRYIKSMYLFPTPLTNAECINLTA